MEISEEGEVHFLGPFFEQKDYISSLYSLLWLVVACQKIVDVCRKGNISGLSLDG